MKLIAIASLALLGNWAYAAVTAEEAKQLGTTLTPFGSEKAGNKEGTIPPYEGGLPTSTNPAGFKKDSGKWVSPFAAEKPLFTITAANMDTYADKLTEGQKVLLKRYPTYSLNIYPTHRTASYPQWVLDKTLRNATAARTAEGGLKIEGAIGGIPFPIPKTGNEVIWNQQTRWLGLAVTYRMHNWYVDATGKQIFSGEVNYSRDAPYYNPKATAESVKNDDIYYQRSAVDFTGPARNVGDGQNFFDTIDPVTKPRRTYVYSPSTRRVRLAPDTEYDTPIASAGGVITYDDAYLFSGKMDRFDFKLIGKKEMFIPYSTYESDFLTPPAKLFMPHHFNPSVLRWELHRVWQVEATLKPGLRHVYSKRVFYVDEDWTGAGVSDTYDGAGKIYKTAALGEEQLYDKQIPWSQTLYQYDLSTGLYVVTNWFGGTEASGVRILDTMFPKDTFAPQSLPARSGQ